jgi:DNA (cytosine-5)-methyltransferase 1
MNRFDLQKRALELTPACWIRKKTGGTDLFGRLWWDRPAFTIRTEFFKPEKGRYLHPEQHRPITHREAARFQSFPDEFVFTGSKIEIARQIGNAVPPVLAGAVADCVYLMWAKAHGLDIQKRFSDDDVTRDYVSTEVPEYASGSSR